VAAAPTVPPLSPPPAVKVPLPVVGATMTWSFGWSHTYTTVKSLVVEQLPAGGSVDVACRGKGCAFRHWRPTVATRKASCRERRCASRGPVPARGILSLASLFKGRRLGIGVRISVRIAQVGWVGKAFVFTVRANRAPRVQVECLASTTSTTLRGC
jgi:hypothetical protein